jgi:hypothetical protein
MHMAELQVTRWRRYGKDRLYVNGPDGVRIGWLDNLSGERVLERPEFADDFEVALAKEGLPAGPALVTATPRPRAPSPAPTRRSEPIWVDLADNRPGQAAREQAIAHREAMREHSKAGTFLARVFDVKNDERAWRVGADGEEAVAARLASLEPDGWRVLHAVNVGSRGSDIDHVAIGPGGVYTLNTKAHLGHRVTVYEHAILVDRYTKPYLWKSRHEAGRATQLLTQTCGFAVTVTPLIVVLCDALTINKQPADVQVVGRRDIALWLRKRPVVLTTEEVNAIWEHARRSTTWQPTH